MGPCLAQHRDRGRRGGALFVFVTEKIPHESAAKFRPSIVAEGIGENSGLLFLMSRDNSLSSSRNEVLQSIFNVVASPFVVYLHVWVENQFVHQDVSILS